MEIRYTVVVVGSLIGLSIVNGFWVVVYLF